MNVRNRVLLLALALAAFFSVTGAQCAAPPDRTGSNFFAFLTTPALTEAEKQRLTKLISDLESQDPGTLDDALWGLLSMGPKAADAVDALAKLLSDDRVITYESVRYTTRYHSFKVNDSAVHVLRVVGGERAMPALIEALDNKTPEVRREAAEGLSHLGRAVPMAVWLKALQNSDPGVRRITAQQLGAVKDASAVAPLAAACKDEDRNVRAAAATALGEIGGDKAIDALIGMLPEPTPEGRYAASRALAKIGSPALKAIIDRFDQFDERAKAAAMDAFGRCEDPAAREVVSPCVESKHALLREAAAFFFINHKLTDTAPALLKLAEDEDAGVRATAVRGLGELAKGRMADAARPVLLKAAATDDDPVVRTWAVESLGRLPGEPLPETWKTIRDLMGHPSPRVREVSAAAARKFWNPALAGPLLELLKDENPRVRAEAATSLSVHQVPEAVPRLIALLDDPDEYSMRHAAVSLSRYKQDEARAALINRVKDRKASRASRDAALTSMLLAPHPSMVDALIVALEDKIDPMYPRLLPTLKEFTHQDFGTDAAKWRAWYEDQKRPAN